MSPFRNLFRREAPAAAESAAAASVPAAPASPRAEPQALPGRAHDLYAEFLKLEGVEMKKCSEDAVVFKRGRFTLLIVISQKDAEYFRMVLPNFWSIDSADERRRALRAAEAVNRTLKVAKVYLDDEGADVSVAVEMFAAAPAQVLPVLVRCIDLLPEAAAKFGAIMALGDG